MKIENRGYEHCAEQLAQQFAHGENVDARDLNYLRDFSDESRRNYDLLMDRVADMYDVASINVTPETTARSLGNLAFNQSTA